MVIETKANRFEVDTAGMAELQSGREPWQLLKELISNSWDEKIRICRVQISPTSKSNRTLVEVHDDGKGFLDITDSWTLMKHTGKRSDPTVRGRFNLGDKELISVAIEATVLTHNQRVYFPESGGRIITECPCTGTMVTAIMPWSRKEADETVEALRTLLPPKGIEYVVNGQQIPYRKPDKVIEWILETQIAEDHPGAPLRHTHRKAAVHILRNGGHGMLYEMGVPVQPIESPYLVDVQQKIPMPPNRDVVRDSYLRDIYAAVLTAMVDELEYDTDNGKTWVRIAVGAKSVPDAVIRKVMEKRYGKKVMLWSSDMKANEKAELHGYEVVNSRSLDPEERKAFERVGLEHTTTQFATPVGDENKEYYLDLSEWTPGMKRLATYAKSLAPDLIGRPIDVRVYRFFSGDAANYGNGVLLFNLATLGHAFFDDPIGPEQTGLIIHEIAHEEGFYHNWKYIGHLEALAGRAVHLALEKPEIFGLARRDR